MVKFKLKIFRSCRSKDPSTLPNRPIPISVPVHNQQPHRSSFKSHVSSAFGCGSKSNDFSDSDNYFQWQEDDQWHVVAKIYDVESPRRKIYNSSVSGDGGEEDSSDDPFPLPLPLLTVTEKKKRRRSSKTKKLKLNKLRGRRSISSCDCESVLFTSDDVVLEDKCYDNYYNYQNDVVLEDETETLISSNRSFSTDTSTDFNPQLETIRTSACASLADRYRQKKNKTTSLKRNGRVNNNNNSNSNEEYGTPTRLSVFKRVIGCDVEGKMKESVAMVKRSKDPYDDFKRSMMEMIMEKKMYEERELEQLLQCYLSLNSRVHHEVIVEAFEEIWDTMFCGGCNDD